MNYDKILQLANHFAGLTKNANLPAAQSRFRAIVSNQASIAFGELNVQQKVMRAINSHNAAVEETQSGNYLTQDDVPTWNYIVAEANRTGEGWQVTVKIDPPLTSRSKEINNILRRYENLVAQKTAIDLNEDRTVFDGKEVKYFSMLWQEAQNFGCPVISIP